MRGSDKSDLGTGGGGGLKIVVLLSSPPLGASTALAGRGMQPRGEGRKEGKDGDILTKTLLARAP